MINELYEQHPLVFENGILGFAGYTADGLFCVYANGDNNFLLHGIAENSLLIVNTRQPFLEDKLNIFQTDTHVHGMRQLKLSLTRLADCPYIGCVMMSVNYYE